jgi:Protein of unknown function (DUF3307)
VLLILTAMLAFQFKHFICDFVLQPYAMVLKKGIYLHPWGLLHAGLHVVGSIPAVLMLTRAPPVVATVLIGEFLIHYHTDWLKSQIDKWLQLDNRSTLHWVIFGADQLIHNATYVAMIYVIEFGF